MGKRETAPSALKERGLKPVITLDGLMQKSRFVQLGPEFYSEVSPTPIPNPFWVSCNASALALINATPDMAFGSEGLALFSGHGGHQEIKPIAMLYSGHQFGVYVPQLGDGRAILIGEFMGSEGMMEIQLKGIGRTPFSRGADGRAVLRSSIREYLCSEAMHALGIPTTRALCITGSHEPVLREQIETAAILTRIAPTHVRFGSFEVFYYRNQHHLSLNLANFIITHYYPELEAHPDKIALWLEKVGIRTAELIAQWQSVGFTHGVLNTDNMSIIGLTLDYGPFGFLDAYQHDFVCNHTDTHGRYAFSQQPRIGLWNLHALVQALSPHLSQDQAAQILEAYAPAYDVKWLKIMRKKLGFAKERDDDEIIISDLIDLMDKNKIDYTRFMRALSGFVENPLTKNEPLRNQFLDRLSFDAWGKRYAERLSWEKSNPVERSLHMNQVNPKYILRNYLAEQAIQQAKHGNFDEIDRLLTILQRPFEEQPEHETYSALPPDWAADLDLSCSS